METEKKQKNKTEETSDVSLEESELKKEESSEVNKEKTEIDRLMEMIKQQSDKIEKLEKDRDMLLSVADKTQLSRYYSRNQKMLPTKVKVRKIDDKFIVGWSDMIENEVYQDPATLRWVENQKIKVIFSDGSSGIYNLRDYVKRYKTEEATIVSKTIDDSDGNTYYTVRVPSGQEFKINVTFLN